MKKYILATVAASLVALSAMAEKVTIYKGGEPIASYELAVGDYVLFSNSTSEVNIAGTYNCLREVTLPAMPNMGVLVSDIVQVKVDAIDAENVSVTLPSCQYTMGTSDFDLPSATVSCAVTKTSGAYSLSGKFEGELNGKASEVTLAATINEDGTFTFTQDMKYGSMPMVLHMVYTLSQSR